MGIAVTSTSWLYDKFHKNLVFEKYDNISHRGKEIFRAGVSSLDHSFCVSKVSEKRSWRCQKIHLLVVNLVASYNKVSLSELGKVLDRKYQETWKQKFNGHWRQYNIYVKILLKNIGIWIPGEGAPYNDGRYKISETFIKNIQEYVSLSKQWRIFYIVYHRGNSVRYRNSEEIGRSN